MPKTAKHDIVAVLSSRDARRPDPLADVLALMVSPDAARIVSAILRMRTPGSGRDIDMQELTAVAGLDDAQAAACERLRDADKATQLAADIAILEPPVDWQRHRASDAPPTLEISKQFAAFLDEPLSMPTSLPIPPVVTESARTWIAAMRAAAGVGGRLHLALRCGRDREIDDLAALLQDQGVPVIRIASPSYDVRTSLLKAELHAEAGSVVLVETECLVLEAAPLDDPDEYVLPSATTSGILQARSFAADALSWLPALRLVHVWRIPASGALPANLRPLIGGCFGPLAYDRAWAATTAGQLYPGVGPAGARALLPPTGDPREATAMATAARFVADGNGIEPDDACALVAKSFKVCPDGASAVPSPVGFDPRLLVCDDDALLLLDRADSAARNGARVLCWGGPGGGKSTYAQAFAARMAETSNPTRPVVVITPATILVRAYGATERIMETLWAQAASDGGILLVDELDALCGVRDAGGASSGNAYLVRTLTDQWLRCFDLYPQVPVAATCNDLGAVDAAVRRRFSFALEFGDALTPAQERLAWTIMTTMTPTREWRPCGASVADIASASARCKTLGVADPASFAKAVVCARQARLGPPQKGDRRSSIAKRLH